MKLLAIDGNSILNRAFYGIRLLTAKDGTYTNGIYGFLNILNRLLQDEAPDAVACAFDLKEPTFRHKRYDGYKAQRKGMPEELAQQMPLLKEILTSLGFRIVECAGYEADDILGTLARAACQNGDRCVIATGDRDSLQLVTDCVTVLLTTTKQGGPESTAYDPVAVRERYGVEPIELIQVKALMGDSSDNIPGVAGIGEKTALSLIQRYHTVDYIYDHIEEIDIKPGVRQKLAAGREMAYLSRELATICCEAPIPSDAQEYRRAPVDNQRAYPLLLRLELRSQMERFGVSAQGVTLPEPAQPQHRPKALRLRHNPPLEGCCPPEGPLNLCVSFEGELLQRMAAVGEEEISLFDGEALPQAAAALLGSGRPLRTYGTKALCHYCSSRGLPSPQVEFDLELAGYLLSPTSTEYTVGRLAEEYRIAAPELEGDAVLGAEGFLADCARFLPLAARLEEEIANNSQDRLLRQIEIPLAGVLASMEELGFELDPDGLREFGVGLDRDLEELEARIYELAGEQFNINSPKQLGEVLFGKLGLPARKKTKSGYSTNAEVLDSLRGKHPIINLILEYRKQMKLKSTYVEGLLKVVGADGRVHSVFKQTETRTGRISSMEPNLQNIPIRTELGSNLRRFFRAKEGCVLVDADYSQIELRVLAHIADDQNMIQAFREGEDIHTITASQVFNLPPDFVTPLMRSRAKAVNFGIVYGISAFSLSQDIGVTVAEAKHYIQEYLNTYSGVKRYMEETVRFAREHGYVKTLLERRRYLPELTASNKNTQAFGERVAMNTPIQGTAADIIKIAMIRVYERLRREGLRSQLILQVHDELIVESPEEEAEQVKALLREEMEGAMELKAPLVADVNCGRTWYEAK